MYNNCFFENWYQRSRDQDFHVIVLFSDCVKRFTERSTGKKVQDPVLSCFENCRWISGNLTGNLRFRHNLYFLFVAFSSDITLISVYFKFSCHVTGPFADPFVDHLTIFVLKTIHFCREYACIHRCC